MKKITLIALSIIVLLSIRGLYILDNKNISIKEFSTAFIEQHLHFDGPAKFAKIHHHIRVRNDNEMPKYKMSYTLKEYNKIKKSLKFRDSKKLNWIERGPGNVGGRTRGLIVDPDDSTHHTFFTGSVGGGVWKTTDAGDTWENLTKDLLDLSTSTLAMSKHNTDIIYAGTGEGFDGLMVKGNGIWKSNDKGISWNVLKSTVDDDRFLDVLRLIVNPEDENEVLACVRGKKGFKSYILKSTDGGNTWDQKYQVQGNTIQQLVYTPGDFTVMYASINNDGIYKSTDSGENWKKVFDSYTKGIARIEMAVSPVNPANVFLSCENREKSSLFYSGDSMKTAKELLINSTSTVSWLGGQGWYDNTIAAHPYDENTVWVGGSGSLLEIIVGKDEKELAVLKEFTNNTSYFIDVVSQNMPIDGDGLASEFAVQLGLNTNSSAEDLVDVEVRFGKDKKQKAHLISFSYSDYTLHYNDMIDVPFEAWDLKNNRQINLSIVDMNNDGEWTFEDYSGNDSDIPDVVLINTTDYNEEGDDLITGGSNVVNKAQYYFYKGKSPAFEGTVDSLPDGNFLFKTGTKYGLVADFEPITDGYGEFRNVSSVGSKGVHVDHHNIIFIPVDSTTQSFYVLNANDGGVAFSSDNGKTFKQTGDTFASGFGSSFETSKGYNVSQFYGVDKMNGSNRYVGGTQDNGSWVSPKDPDDKSVWASAPSGDGFEAAWNYKDTNMLLESSQYNNLFKSTNGGLTWYYVNLPESNGPFLTRISSSQLDPDLVFVCSDKGLIKSTDFGDSWEIKQMPNTWRFSFFGSPTAISLADANIVWSGAGISHTNRIALSRDKGETWIKTSNYNMTEMGNATGIATHPIDSSTAYVLFSQANGPKILKTSDFGDSWVDISGFGVDGVEESKNGFPNVATYSLLVMPFDTNTIWVGTEIGLFESSDGGNSWHYADNGIPAVGIWQMKIVNDQIVVATHGRGIWTVNTNELVATTNPIFEKTDLVIIPNPVIDHATISFEIKDLTTVSLDLFSIDGKKVRNLLNTEISGKKEVVFNKNNLMPGTYILTLKTKYGTSTKKLIIL